MEYSHPGNQPDEYVRCPYFPEHELRRSRLPYHIVKCQNHPRAPKLVACPYNFMHRVKPEDREDHVMLCEDRIPLKYTKRQAPSYATTLKEFYGVTKAKPSKLSKPKEENWDEESESSEIHRD